MRAYRYVAVLAVLTLGLCVRLLAFPFWLDAPKRSNPHDPKSDLFHAAPIGTPTPDFTKTPSPTFSASPTPLGTFTITPTASPTALGPLKLYDGDTAGSKLADGSINTSPAPAGGGHIGLSEVSAGGGAASTTNYLRLTMSADVGAGYGEFNYYIGGAAVDAGTSYNALSFYVRIPSNSCTTSFRPMIQLLSTGGAYPDDHSLPVTVTAYLVGTTAMGYDSWIQVLVPLTAFLGTNYEGGSFPASRLNTINGFQIQEFQGSINADNSIPLSELHIDQVQFVSVGSLPGLASHGRVFDDFENSGHTEWNTYKWQVAQDSITCTTQTNFTFPVGGVGNTPIDTPGNSLTACHAAHIAGYVNANTTCPSSIYPYANMAAYFSPNGSGNYVDLSNNNWVNFSPSTGAHGMVVRMKTSLPGNGQVYLVRLHRKADETASNFDDYQVWISDAASDPNPVTSSWKSFVMTFPTDGTMPPNLNTGSGATQLGFAQQGWGTPETWSRSDLEYITIMPNNIGMTFDLWVDDVEFY